MKSRLILALATLTLLSTVRADVLDDIKPIQQRWAEVSYQLDDDKRADAFAQLLAQADEVVQANAGKAEAYIWRGIVASGYAGAKGGLGALSLAKQSKADLEQALQLDDTALLGSAYTSLGALYYKVPGWPVGFGSDKKARLMLEKALALNPQGIDPNYFYAEFLMQQRDYTAAMRYLEIAKQAPARPDRLLADSGRRQELQQLEKKLHKKLKTN
jgi:cytochrome c-type biogenesis protein CcmH/NrfG